VGEDEADAEHGLVSYVSPLAQALLGARVGDEVRWQRPAGDMTIEVLNIEYA
jgi:transcription elongation factor GreB